MIHPMPINNRQVDSANENGNEVTPRTNTRLIWGLSSTETLWRKSNNYCYTQLSSDFLNQSLSKPNDHRM